VQHTCELDNPADRAVVGPHMLREMEEQVVKIRHNSKAAQDRKKSCIDKGQTFRELKVGDHVFLKVKSRRSFLKLGNCSKLAVSSCGSFEILERIGTVASILSFPASLCIHNVLHVSLLKMYVPDSNHVIDWNVILVEPKGDFLVQLVCILDQKVK
jgi:hypothetical protein